MLVLWYEFSLEEAYYQFFCCCFYFCCNLHIGVCWLNLSFFLKIQVIFFSNGSIQNVRNRIYSLQYRCIVFHYSRLVAGFSLFSERANVCINTHCIKVNTLLWVPTSTIIWLELSIPTCPACVLLDLHICILL